MKTSGYPIAVMLMFSLASGASGKTVKPMELVQTGRASWYRGKGSTEALTAAHRTLPFGTYVRVTNLKNDKSVVVRINDRGPYIRGRIIDVNRRAARELDLMKSGIAKVRIEVMPASPNPP
ncbi:MAG: septal ring lytic transglycosylase RlpA family protein [Chthoniobacteraceae bacterium]